MRKAESSALHNNKRAYDLTQRAYHINPNMLFLKVVINRNRLTKNLHSRPKFLISTFSVWFFPLMLATEENQNSNWQHLCHEPDRTAKAHTLRRKKGGVRSGKVHTLRNTSQWGVIPFLSVWPHSHANHPWLQVANLETVWVFKSSDGALGKNVADT